MKLSREQKEGQITKNKIKMEFAMALTIGNLAFGSMMFGLTVAQNKSDSKKEYSKQLEDVLNTNVSDDLEIVLGKMNESLNLANNYNKALTEIEKEEYLDKIVSDKDKVRRLSLQIIKMNEAKKHGGTWDEYEIKQGEGLVSWLALQTTYDEHGVSHGNVYNLDVDSAKLVNAIIALDNSSYLDGNKSESSRTKFVNNYQKVIDNSAEFIGKATQKEGKAK